MAKLLTQILQDERGDYSAIRVMSLWAMLLVTVTIAKSWFRELTEIDARIVEALLTAAFAGKVGQKFAEVMGDCHPDDRSVNE